MGIKGLIIFLPIKVIVPILSKYTTVLIKILFVFWIITQLLSFQVTLLSFPYSLLDKIHCRKMLLLPPFAMFCLHGCMCLWKQEYPIHVAGFPCISHFFLFVLNFTHYLVVCGTYLLYTHLSNITSFKMHYSIIPTWESRVKISQNMCWLLQISTGVNFPTVNF